ncbi:hypothetical protein B2J88_45835 [Rhodococcus sp. SRB_17]|nr:hypothetical protein [Rhodococcus sp. SRB_17]
MCGSPSGNCNQERAEVVLTLEVPTFTNIAGMSPGNLVTPPGVPNIDRALVISLAGRIRLRGNFAEHGLLSRACLHA